MRFGNARPRGPGLFILLGGISLLGTALPAACNSGGGLAPSEAGATGGANRGTAMDAAATGGSGGQVGDEVPFDHPVDSSGGDSAVAGAAGTPSVGDGGGTGGTGGGEGGRAGSAGGASGGGGAAGRNMNDAGPPDSALSDGGLAQGGAGGGVPSDGSSGGDGVMMDGGSPDVMFPCGPCSPHWICGGYGDATETDVILTPEEDGCYLAGLSGHVLLAPDGTVTENRVPLGRAQKFGPQVGFYHPDGSQWFYCGGNLPCSP